MCELPHTSLLVQKMHRARERSKVDKDIPESAATRAVNLTHAQPATEEPGVLRAELKFSESRQGPRQAAHPASFAGTCFEVRGLGFPGPWVKHSPPKRLLNASAVAVSGKQNRTWNRSASCRLRPRRTGMRRSRWNASISRKTLRKPPGGSASSTRCGKSRSFVRPTISRLRRVISPNPGRPRPLDGAPKVGIAGGLFRRRDLLDRRCFDV